MRAWQQRHSSEADVYKTSSCLIAVVVILSLLAYGPRLDPTHPSSMGDAPAGVTAFVSSGARQSSRRQLTNVDADVRRRLGTEPVAPMTGIVAVGTNLAPSWDGAVLGPAARPFTRTCPSARSTCEYLQDGSAWATLSWIPTL